MSLKTLAPDTTAREIGNALRTEGACIVRDVLSPAEVEQINAETSPWIEQTQTGKDDFTGRKTKRTGALIARAPSTRDVILHPLLLAGAHDFLDPYCDTIQLHLTQTINILPGAEAQYPHRDRLAWGTYLPLSIEPQFNTIWALTDFTEENGATNVVPGSHTWPWERKPEPSEVHYAEMSAGSVLVYSGTVVHGGGENRSDAARIGMNITYCLGWLRTEENNYLSCPPSIAKDLPPELTDLLGYTMGNYALGYYSNPERLENMPDTLPPEIALGRMPSKRSIGSVLLDKVAEANETR